MTIAAKLRQEGLQQGLQQGREEGVRTAIEALCGVQPRPSDGGQQEPRPNVMPNAGIDEARPSR